MLGLHVVSMTLLLGRFPISMEQRRIEMVTTKYNIQWSLVYTPSISKQNVTMGEISLKLRQTTWNVARNNVNVVANEPPSQITIYTCLTTNIWTRWR